jgi:hypothetical protein
MNFTSAPACSQTRREFSPFGEPSSSTHSWFNRFRRLLIRWEKKPENYLAFLHFTCAWVTFRAAGILG